MIGTKNKKFRRSGFTLMEVMVSVALFSLVILSATSIFKMVIDSQRSALATQNVQESLKYFFEVTAKEIRMAQKDDGLCSRVPDGEVFAVSSNSFGDVLDFKNYYNECVTYELAEDGDNLRFRITRNTKTDFISPGRIRIDRLNFVLEDDPNIQPAVTISLNAYALNERQFKSEMNIQTTITSRYYK